MYLYAFGKQATFVFCYNTPIHTRYDSDVLLQWTAIRFKIGEIKYILMINVQNEESAFLNNVWGVRLSFWFSILKRQLFSILSYLNILRVQDTKITKIPTIYVENSFCKHGGN